MPEPTTEPLRARLVEMRATLLAKLAASLNGGDLALLGSVQLALEAVEAAAAEDAAGS